MSSRFVTPELKRLERHPEGADGGIVGRHDQLRKIGLESAHLQVIQGKATDEEDRVIEQAVGNDGAHVVPGVSHMKAVDDVFKPFPFVLQVNHIGLGENRAPAGHIGRLSRSSNPG